jgi:hypothetical protein
MEEGSSNIVYTNIPQSLQEIKEDGTEKLLILEEKSSTVMLQYI